VLRAARAARRRLHGPDDGAVVAPVRGGDLVRVGGRQASRTPSASRGRERRRAGRPVAGCRWHTRRPDTDPAPPPPPPTRHPPPHRPRLAPPRPAPPPPPPPA